MALHVDYTLDIDQLPRECIADCSAPGPADEAVTAWRKRLGFTVDRDGAIRYLQGTGAWELDELQQADSDTLAERILWLACGDFRDYLSEVERGRGDAPHCGSSFFCLE